MGYIADRCKQMTDLLEMQREMIESEPTFANDESFEQMRLEMLDHIEALERLEPIDSVTQSVIRKLTARSQKGVRTYSQTMDRDDLTDLQWLRHLHEELLDGSIYAEKLMQELQSKNSGDTNE
jgi:hypothetical protein